MRGFAFVPTKAVLVRKSRRTFRDAQTKGSLYTREAHYRPTVHLKCNTLYLATFLFVLFICFNSVDKPHPGSNDIRVVYIRSRILALLN